MAINPFNRLWVFSYKPPIGIINLKYLIWAIERTIANIDKMFSVNTPKAQAAQEAHEYTISYLLTWIAAMAYHKFAY